MMDTKQQADFHRCASFMAEMIAKYGTAVLAEMKAEEETSNTQNVA